MILLHHLVRNTGWFIQFWILNPTFWTTFSILQVPDLFVVEEMLGQLLFILIVAEIQTITGTDCHRPKRVDTQFDIGSTDGPWFVVRGLNNAYDCFNSHNITFYPAHHDVFFSVEYYDVKVNESIKRVKVESTVTQWNASSPGILRLLECLVSWNTSIWFGEW